MELFDDALAADVLAAPHHGSKNAAHAGMALAVMPNTVLISAGVDNQYDHPDGKALRLYLRVGGPCIQDKHSHWRLVAHEAIGKRLSDAPCCVIAQTGCASASKRFQQLRDDRVPDLGLLERVVLLRRGWLPNKTSVLLLG